MSGHREEQVSLADDGYVPEPRIMAERLCHLTGNGDVSADYYGNGGAVEQFERSIAEHLGKERAVMFPTGTLANLIAMKCLTRAGGRRIIVHRQSHLYNDSGDNLSQVGNFTMLPLENDKGGFSAGQIKEEIARAVSARVADSVGCIAIESPNRRLFGMRFDSSDIKEISGLAGQHQIPLFLDGARMLIECAYTGRQPRAMSEPFELVYMSLYKYLGAPFGCILAGPGELLDEVFHQRRRYGGGLYQMWPAAVLASGELSKSEAKWKNTIPASEDVIAILAADDSLVVERVPQGTNIFHLGLRDARLDADKLKPAALQNGLKLPELNNDRLPVKVNETWLNRTPGELAEQIVGTLLDGRA